MAALSHAAPIAACLAAWGLALAAACGPAVGAVWVVKPGEKIAAAIDKAAAGDTVKIERGYFEERLVIAKPLMRLSLTSAPCTFSIQMPKRL
jgi:hypothetical protein